MPRKNQVKGYATQRLAGGRTGHYWKPSPRERREGWSTICYGTGDEGRRAALHGCLEQNDKVEAARATSTDHPERGRRTHVRLRFRDLVKAYKADPAFLDLKPKSRVEYGSRINTLATWAEDGATPLDQLDRAMIVDLRNILVADGRKHRTAALLRVLRILLNFAAAQGWLAPGLAAQIDIPEAPARRRILPLSDVERLIDRARDAGQPRLALAILLGFWTFQREGDLLGLARINWREMPDMSAQARKVLAGPDGRVLGFRLQQGKTGAWVDLALPHRLRVEVEAGFAGLSVRERALGLLLPCPCLEAQPDRAPRAWPAWAFQRAFRALVEAEALADVQFRDLRRSGMVHFGEQGVPIQFITAMSGHSVLGNKRTILDTYMPGNSRFAAEGMAIAVARQAERDAAEQEKAK